MKARIEESQKSLESTETKLKVEEAWEEALKAKLVKTEDSAEALQRGGRMP